MFRIKLLTLLFNLFLLFSCANKPIDENYDGFTVEYIGGGFDGLYLSNTLITNLKMMGIYNPESRYVINASISHGQNVYITNIDKTSDREKITSSLEISIRDRVSKCKVYTYDDLEEQFYVIAASNYFISNTKARDKIRMSNTDILVNNFLSEIRGEYFRCSYINLYEYTYN